MSELLNLFDQLVSEHIAWLVAISVLTFIGSLMIVPWIILRLPTDYFSHDKRVRIEPRNVAVALVVTIIRNIIGGVLLLSGLVMLITPGQGLLTLAAGLMIMNYPGKYRFEKWLIRRFRLLRAMNWLRRKYHRKPLVHP